MNAPQQIAPDILCLAHTAKKIEWCDRAETCERHVAIRRDGIGNCGQCQWSAGRARSETRRIDKETGMKIQTVEDAIEAYTAQDAWQFADRQAAWAWMFEQGRKAGMNECYRLAMTASEPAKGGSFNDGKWAVADAIKMRAAGGCDCMTCTCQPDD